MRIMNVNESQRIRLALAFVVLRHKTRDVSTSAFVLDLRHQFPLKNTSNEDSNTPWRVRALQLEETLDSLKRKHSKDLAELDILRANACTENPSNSTVRNGVSKRRKLNAPTAVGSENESVSTIAISASSTKDIHGTTAGPHAPALQDALHILSSYNKLCQLSCVEHPQDDRLHIPGRLLHSATLVLQAVAKTLRTILHTSSKPMCTYKVIADVNAVLCSTLSQVILLLKADKRISKNTRVPKSHNKPSLNTLFAVLASDIVVPLIKAFGNLSEGMLLEAFLDTTGQSSFSRYGSRPASCATLDGILVTLREIIATVRSEGPLGLDLLNIMKLSAIAEIERIYTLSGKESTGDIHSLSSICETTFVHPRIGLVTRFGRRNRLYRLGRKDALWYLCSVINEATVPTTVTRHEPVTFAAVQSKSEAILSTLLGRCSVPEIISPKGGPERMLKMDTVEMGMVASIIEKIWLAG